MSDTGKESPRHPSSKRTQRYQTPIHDADPSKRKFITLLGGGALALGAAALGVNVLKPKSPDSPYQGWEKFKNTTLPKDITLDIAADITRNTQYPGFSDVGLIMTSANTTPSELTAFTAPWQTVEPVPIGLVTDLIKNSHAVSRLRAHITHEGHNFSIRSRREPGRQPQTGLLTNLTGPVQYTVEMDSNLANSSEAVRKLLIVKEFSHFLFYQQHKQLVASQVMQDYQINIGNLPVDMSDLIYTSSQDKINFPDLSIPSLGDLFDNAKTDLDAAGYWHVMKAYAKMKDANLFSRQELETLGTIEFGLSAVKEKGLLVKQGTDYQWTSGITPFAQPWLSIGRAIVKGQRPY